MEANPSIDQGVLGLAWLTGHFGSQEAEPGPVHLHSGEWREDLPLSLAHRLEVD